jgi:hypothetical protein
MSGVFVPLDFIKINDGNLYDAVLFSHVMSWHEPASDGKLKLTVFEDGHYWLAKNHSDWESECGIKRSTVRVALKRLEQRKLIVYKVGGVIGEPVPLIRIDWLGVEKRIKELTS